MLNSIKGKVDWKGLGDKLSTACSKTKEYVVNKSDAVSEATALSILEGKVFTIPGCIRDNGDGSQSVVYFEDTTLRDIYCDENNMKLFSHEILPEAEDFTFQIKDGKLVATSTTTEDDLYTSKGGTESLKRMMAEHKETVSGADTVGEKSI